MNGYYCGLDVSNKSTAVCVVNASGRVVKQLQTSTTERGLREGLKEYKGLRCVVEAGPLAESICNFVEKVGHKIEILDPRRAKAVTSGKRKTDKLDAEKLAQVCRTGWYTRVHRKSGKARGLRSYLTARMQMVKTAGALASTIRGIFRAHGIIIAVGKDGKFEANVLQALKKAEPMLHAAITPLLKAWKGANLCEKQMYRTLNRQVARQSQEIRNLMTVPGVGPATAAAFVATIDTPKRFASSEQVGDYFGLVPSLYQSGEVEIRGRITKHGDELMRFLLVEAATTILSRCKKNFALRQWGLKLQEKKDFGKARVAVARKLACLLHHLWITGKPFDASRAVAA